MFGFLIVLCCLGAGLAFGLMMIVGMMFYSGKWTLAGTEQRRIQRAQVDLEVARLSAETAQARLLREDFDHNRELQGMKHIEAIQELQDNGFRKALTR